MIKKGLKVFLVIAVLITSACSGGDKESQNDSEVSTDLVNNPKTANDTEEDAAKPEFEFDSEIFNFGEISQGEKVEHKFRFKNVGDANLIISSAKGSCGCTVPEWPKEPIKPGETGVINVIYDSNGKRGKQNKTVTIVANTSPNSTVLALKGMVKPPKKEQE